MKITTTVIAGAAFSPVLDTGVANPGSGGVFLPIFANGVTS
jgi:hypothetical protein